MTISSQHPLDARARQLLRTLIARYIAEGQPIGSRTLAKASGLDVSPATIRNIMSDLEEFGLVAAPHTSAGRVPTSQGYRVFVDSLIEMQPLGEPELDQLRRELPTDVSTPDLLGSATLLLSEMTHFVGVVSVPNREEFRASITRSPQVVRKSLGIADDALVVGNIGGMTTQCLSRT